MPVARPQPPDGIGAVVLSANPAPPPLRLPCPPPARQSLDDFGLLLRRLIILRGWDEITSLDPDLALPLLERCASSDRERQAVRAFSPLVSCGLLQLLKRHGANPQSLCRSIAHRVTIRPELVATIAADLRATLNQALKPIPTSSIEQLTMAGAVRLAEPQGKASYNTNLWIGLLAFAGLGLGGAALMAFGMGNRIGELRAAATTSTAAAATPQPSVPQEPAVQEPAAAAAVPTSPDASASSPESGDALASGRWRACAALPTQAAVGNWGVLAPIAALREVRQRCHDEARPFAGGVLLARFEQRTSAEELASELSVETGQTLQIISLSEP